MACPRTSACPFYEKIHSKPLLEVWKTFYCDADYERCERYKLFKAGKVTPDELLPNGKTMDT